MLKYFFIEFLIQFVQKVKIIQNSIFFSIKVRIIIILDKPKHKKQEFGIDIIEKFPYSDSAELLFAECINSATFFCKFFSFMMSLYGFLSAKDLSFGGSFFIFFFFEFTLLLFPFYT